MPLNSCASSFGISVTARPCATSARLAIASRESISSRGLKPAAWHARAITPSALGATHGSSASASSGTASRVRERMPGPEGDEERLAGEVLAHRPVVLAPRLRRVLEADRQVQLAAPDALGELGRGALLDEHLRGRAAARHRLRHERGQRARERAHAQALVAGQLRQLRAGERQAVGERVGVLEQDLARGRELQPAGLAVQQPRADLLLQRGDLLRDGRLRERERSRGGAERALVGHRPERQQPSRVHRLSL